MMLNFIKDCRKGIYEYSEVCLLGIVSYLRFRCVFMELFVCFCIFVRFLN